MKNKDNKVSFGCVKPIMEVLLWNLYVVASTDVIVIVIVGCLLIPGWIISVDVVGNGFHLDGLPKVIPGYIKFMFFF